MTPRFYVIRFTIPQSLTTSHFGVVHQVNSLMGFTNMFLKYFNLDLNMVKGEEWCDPDKCICGEFNTRECSCSEVKDRCNDGCKVCICQNISSPILPMRGHQRLLPNKTEQCLTIHDLQSVAPSTTVHRGAGYHLCY